ncbi:MAG: cytochrome P460 family protein [Pseudomonadales bacterium]|nr:cytochrome P460 family protein [Pseudomonadales bacterium]
MPDTWQDYQSWYKVTPEPTTGDPTGFLDELHEGNTAYRMIYVNSIGEAVNKGEAPFPYPEGTVLVKETFGSQAAWENQRGRALTIMVKLPQGTSPGTGDWEYINGGMGYRMFGMMRGAENTRMGTFCGGCHVRAFATDFNFINSQFHERQSVTQLIR